MVARVLVPVLTCVGTRLHPPPPGDHKGLVKIPRIFLALPRIIHPRPYGSSGLLPIFQAEVDAYWWAFMAARFALSLSRM